MRKPEKQDNGPLRVWSYENRKGRSRVSASMPRELAAAIAVKDIEAFNKLQAAIARLIEREELQAMEEDESESGEESD